MASTAVGKPPAPRPFRRLHPDLPPARNSLYDPWQCGFLHDRRKGTCLFDVRDAQRAMRALGFGEHLWTALGQARLTFDDFHAHVDEVHAALSIHADTAEARRRSLVPSAVRIVQNYLAWADRVCSHGTGVVETDDRRRPTP